MDELIISVFYKVDNFCKELNSYFQHYFYPMMAKTYPLKYHLPYHLVKL